MRLISAPDKRFESLTSRFGAKFLIFALAYRVVHNLRMHNALKALPPDLTFELLPQTEEAMRFSFAIKKDAMGQHIAARWGWNEDFQFHTHRQRFEAKPLYAIAKHREAAGTLSWTVEANYIRFGEFYLLEQFRGAGLGTRILAHLLAEADQDKLPVRLEYLRWNPVGSLYRRHGFVDTFSTETHFHLERPALVP